MPASVIPDAVEPMSSPTSRQPVVMGKEGNPLDALRVGSGAFEPFVQQFVTQLLSYLRDERPSTPTGSSCGASPVTYLDPAALEAQVLAPMRIGMQGVSPAQLLQDVQKVMDASVRTGHRHTVNQLFHECDTVALLADWLTSTLNTSVYTYELAPVATLIEMECIRRYGQRIGWATAEGAFPPGGSTSNLYGICMARQRVFPHVREDGWSSADRPRIFVSQAGHYSTLKSAMLMGMGRASVVEVPTCSATGAMDAEALGAALTASVASGERPMCVVATVGTTLTGAVDPLDSIATLCAQHDVWMHVDGCLGGSLIHCQAHRPPSAPLPALAGLHRSDSFSVNAHKMMGVPLQCSAILTPHKGMMRATFSTSAAYLFNDDKEYDQSYDVGDSVFSCGRRVDCLKLWAMWRFRGDDGMAQYVDRALHAHKKFSTVLDADPRFIALIGTPSAVPCTCFWYVPARFRSTDAVLTRETLCSDFAAEGTLSRVMNAMVPKAKLLMMQEGFAILTMSKSAGMPNFWRFVANGAHAWDEAGVASFLEHVARSCEAVLSA